MAKIPKGSLDSMEVQLVMREEYETAFGIFNHDDPNKDKTRPLALVAMHQKEQYGPYSRLHQTIRRYRHHDIGEKFKLSLNDFLELPRDMIELLFEISVEEAQRGGSEAEKAMKALEGKS